jgi:hypothetical protein
LFLLVRQSILKKLQLYSSYTHKLQLLCELHLCLGNYVEAALCVLLHADEYFWKQPVDSPTNISKSNSFSPARGTKLPSSPRPASSPASPRFSSFYGATGEKLSDDQFIEDNIMKELLYHKAIQYFGLGKYWELGISLLQELRKVQQNYFRTAVQNLEMERNYYQNIRYKDRFFEQYFLVHFLGNNVWPKHLQVGLSHRYSTLTVERRIGVTCIVGAKLRSWGTLFLA